MYYTDLTKLFSCCTKGDRVESPHQLAILGDWFTESQKEELVELRIIEALYSENPIDYQNKKTMDMIDKRDKQKQIKDFLDYHLAKYGDISFIDGVRHLIYFQSGLDRPASVGKKYFAEPQINFVTRVINEWCDEKATFTNGANTNKQINKMDSLLNPLEINEYTQESEIIKNSTPELKIIYAVLKQYSDYPVLQMINDLRRIEQYHESKQDLCIELIKTQYPMRWVLSTVFVECVKTIIDNNSDFIFQLKLETSHKLLHSKAQQDFALKLDEARKQINTNVESKEDKPQPSSKESTTQKSEQKNPKENEPKKQESTTIQQNIVNNYGGSNNVSIGDSNQNKQETTENKNDSKGLSWTKAGVVVTIISVVVAIIIGIISNWEKIFG